MPYKDPIKAKENAAKRYQRDRKKRDAANKQWIKDHPKEFRAIQKRYEATEKGKIAVKKKERKYKKTDKHKLRIRRSHLKQTYKLTLEQYDEMLEKQGGVCAICGKAEVMVHQNGSVKRLAVDHNHDTGQIRGLLCARCNAALGQFGDNIEHLRSAINYLTTYIRPA